MSLHIGNLSSDIRIEDLYHVFRRFGWCTIQVKDKYGFVVYNYPASAEKALKTLRGQRICGQALTLSWSKHQPRTLQRFSTGGKSYVPPHRRYSVKENKDRMLGSYDLRDKEMNSSKGDGEIQVGASDLFTSCLLDESKPYAEESIHASLTDCHGRGGAGKNHLEDDRWGEQVVDPSNEYYFENNMEFDRYEPYHSDDQKELDELQGISPFSGSPSIKKTQDITGNAYNGKSNNSCYLCGDVGHKMSKCSLKLKGHMPSHRGKLYPSGDAVPLRYQEIDKELSISKSHQSLLENGDLATLQITPKGRRKEFRGKKRNRRDYENQDKNHLKRARGPSSSSIHSDYTSSRSKSASHSGRSLTPLPSISNSKLASLKKISTSDSLGSSPSHDSGSKDFKLLSSMSPSSSLLPVKVNGNVSSSPNKILKDSKGSAETAVGLTLDINLSEEETQVTRYTSSFRPENVTLTEEEESETEPAVLDLGVLKKDPSEENLHSHSTSRDSEEILESLAQNSDDGNQVDNSVLQTVKGMSESQNNKSVVAPESCNFSSSTSSNSLKMSIEEVCTILKHYGLQHPEENEKDLPVETYFGSARLWPWEIIYYMRLKRGPISTESYSRRIAQNEEFGIVDKYIRGSSGWGELDENNP